MEAIYLLTVRLRMLLADVGYTDQAQETFRTAPHATNTAALHRLRNQSA